MVVFPAPEGPMMAVRLPLGRVKLTRESTCPRSGYENETSLNVSPFCIENNLSPPFASTFFFASST